MARFRTFEAEEKARIVLSVLHGDCTVADAAQRNQCSEQAVANWCNQFMQGGLTALEHAVWHKRLSRIFQRPITWMAALAAILTLFDFLGWGPARIWTYATWRIAHGFSLPTCNQPAWLRSFRPEGAFSYYLPHPQDHNAWVTIGTDQDRSWEGEYHPKAPSTNWISWTFGHSEDVTEVCIRNGWDRDINTYSRTARINSIVVTGCHHTVYPEKCGCHTSINKKMTLPDAFQPGAYDTKRFACRTKIVTLWIYSIHDGTGPDYSHPAISHVEFYSDAFLPGI
jgi:hypothetical protein